jgi:GTPase SAR1 family protein
MIIFHALNRVSLCFKDVNSGERFATITSGFYRASHAIIVVFDIKNRQTFSDIPMWLKEIRNFGVNSPAVFICGNFIDEEDRRAVSTEEALKFATENNAHYMETSAKTGLGVKEMFLRVACFAIKRREAAVPTKVSKDKPKKNAPIATFFKSLFSK